MKRRNCVQKKFFALCLALILCLPSGIFASVKDVNAATAKLTVGEKNLTYLKDSKTIKAGKTVVTVEKASIIEGDYAYAQFKVKKAGTYQFTISNLRKSGKKSTKDDVTTNIAFKSNKKRDDILPSDGYIKFKQNNDTAYDLRICSAKHWSASPVASPTVFTPMKKRTASIKLKKGEVIYLEFISRAYRISCDVNIKMK